MKALQNIVLTSLLPALVACGSSGVETSDGGTYKGDQQGDDNSTEWTPTELVALSENGLLKVNIQTVLDGNDLHVFYFDDHTEVEGETFEFGEEFEAGFDLMHLVWNIATEEITTQPEVVETLDNSASLSAAFSNYDSSANTIYQGGYIPDSCQTGQGNVMVSSADSIGWYDETAALGLVERTVAVLEDGLAGGAMDIAIDEYGNRHIAYQFYYEGCGTGELTNPDLNYVQLSAGADYASLSNDDYASLEEQVDGNTYDSGYELDDVGDVNSIVINSDGEPVILYYSESYDDDGQFVYGLKAAVRNGADDWSTEWIEELDSCEVEGLDASLNSEGYISAAVYTYGCESDDEEREENYGDSWHKLHYLSQTDTGWDLETINVSTQIGKYPSLAFDTSGNPMIAYYEIESYSGNNNRTNLQVAYKEGGSWNLEYVAEYDNQDIGKYNQLQITSEGIALLTSYYASENSILLFEKDLTQ